MKLLQNCWSELLILNLLFLQTTHDCVDELLVVSKNFFVIVVATCRVIVSCEKCRLIRFSNNLEIIVRVKKTNL
jgi:hypothetical protein